MKKNVASQSVDFEMLSTSDGSPVTSGTPTVYIVGDNGTQATGTGTKTHKGNGCWSYVPTQAETNYDHIAFTMVLSGAFTQTVNIYTTTPQTGDAYAVVNSGTHGNAALKTLIDTIDGIVDAILVDTGTTLDGKVNTIDTVVDAIKAVTDNLPDSGALTALTAYVDTLESTLANASHGLAALKTLIDTIDNFVDTEVADIKTVTDKLDTALELDGAVYRYTTNALEQAPGGGGSTNPNMLLDTTVSSVTSQTEFVLTAGSDVNDSYNDQSIVLYDATNGDYPSIRKIVDYTGSTKTVIIDSAPDFTLAAGDGIKVFVTAPGSTAPTAAQVADAVWDEAVADHTTGTTFGGKNQKVVPSEALNDYKADVSGVATAAALSTHDGKLDTVDTNIDTLITRLTAARAGYLDKLNVTGTLAHSNAAATYKADVSALATTAALATVDTIVDAIKLKTDNLPSDPADQSLVEAAITSAHTSTDSTLTTILGHIDTEIADILMDTGTTIPALIAALNDLSSADVNAACDTALADYGANTTTPPTTAAIADAVMDEILPDLADNALNVGEDMTARKILRALFNRLYREVTQTASAQVVKNDSGAQIASMAVSDDGTTQTKGEAT